MNTTFSNSIRQSVSHDSKVKIYSDSVPEPSPSKVNRLRTLFTENRIRWIFRKYYEQNIQMFQVIYPVQKFDSGAAKFEFYYTTNTSFSDTKNLSEMTIVLTFVSSNLLISL